MTLVTPAERRRFWQVWHGRAIPRVPSCRTRATQTVEPGVNLLHSRASAWTSGQG